LARYRGGHYNSWDVDEPPPRAVVLACAVSLFAFGALTFVALVAWFTRAAEPWNWRTAVAILTGTSSLSAAALVWRAPSRGVLFFGIAALATSLVRIGPPAEWTWITGTLVAATLLLLVPLIHATTILR
jgi:hypothetical protein